MKQTMTGAQETKLLRAQNDHHALSMDMPVTRGIQKPARLLIYAGCILACILLWQKLSRLLFQVLLAVLLSVLCAPLAAYYEKKLPRAASCLLAVCTLLVGAVLVIALLIPPLISQFRLLIDQLPRLLQSGEQLLHKWEESRLFSAVGAYLSPDMPGKVLSSAGKWLTEQSPRVLSSLLHMVESISQAFISPVLCYYFLRDRETFCYQLSLWIPLRHRKRVLIAMGEVRREAGGYIRGQVLVALCVGALTALGLMLIGVPAYLVLGLVMGICEVIPYVGPLLGGIPIVLFSWPQGMTAVLWALGITIAVQQLESMVIAPRLMAGATGLHPAYVILLLTAGGMLMGLSGMLIALPLFVCLRGFLRVLHDTPAL